VFGHVRRLENNRKIKDVMIDGDDGGNREARKTSQRMVG